MVLLAGGVGYQDICEDILNHLQLALEIEDTLLMRALKGFLTCG